MSVEIGSGALAGKGVYATRDFKMGDVVIKYNLRTLTGAEYDALPESERQFIHFHEGVAHFYSEPERYVNHSDKPNTVQDWGRMADVASRDIKVGEMITTDSTKDDTP